MTLCRDSPRWHHPTTIKTRAATVSCRVISPRGDVACVMGSDAIMRGSF